MSLQERLREEYPDVDLWIREREDRIVVKRLVIPEGQRGSGVGSAVMEDVVDYADRTGKVVSAQPSTDFGASSMSRLKDFYSSFGFVDNSGRNKDFAISESMYRRPGGGGL